MRANFKVKKKKLRPVSWFTCSFSEESKVHLVHGKH